MADEQENTEAASESKGGGFNLMLVLMVGGIMLVEGVLVFAAAQFLAGPAQAAGEIVDDGTNDKEQPIELPLIDDRFQNMQSGRVWGWAVEAHLKVRQRNQAEVERIQLAQEAEIREGIALIFRRAQDRHLREPGLETLSRQLTTYVHQVFGTDQDGIPLVDRVIIAKLKGTPEDI